MHEKHELKVTGISHLCLSVSICGLPAGSLLGSFSRQFASIRRKTALVLTFLLTACSLVSAVTASALTIATYNVENYLVTGRMVDGVYRPSYPKPEAEKTALRAVISGLSPDILALQEMGSQPFLAELQHDLKIDGADYPYAVVLEAADPDRHVAVLSKLPFKEVLRDTAVPINFHAGKGVVKRGVLEVTVATGAGDVTIFMVHLKSRLTEWPDDPAGATQRLLEAGAVRDLMLARFPDPAVAKFIVCGDWNDTRDSKPVKTLTKRGEAIVGEILNAADSRGETWTHHYLREDSYSRIDYFLVSPALKPLVADGVAHIFDGPGVEKASDHRPVYVKLNIPPANRK
jgi:endonuclease/exonuclease/phosphatase family metal-dependent hydrolase